MPMQKHANMFKVEFTEGARIELHIFIQKYEDSFVELYSDTGIWSENEIIEGFIKSSRMLYQRIRSAIIEKLGSEKVLGRKIVGKLPEIRFHVGNRLIIILFSEDKENKIRWISSFF